MSPVHNPFFHFSRLLGSCCFVFGVLYSLNLQTISSRKIGRVLPLVVQVILIDLALASEALLLFQLQAVPGITSDEPLPIMDKINEVLAAAFLPVHPLAALFIHLVEVPEEAWSSGQSDPL